MSEGSLQKNRKRDFSLINDSQKILIEIGKKKLNDPVMHLKMSDPFQF